MSRKRLLRYVDKSKPVLEIGPLCFPTIKRPEYDVCYADVRSTDEVRAHYAGVSEVIEDDIVNIDYVIMSTYADACKGKKFGTVFSSHVLEHTGDIIEHFDQIAEILDEGGAYVLAIPDKRFTFDHFREVTPFRDVYDVHINHDWSRFAVDARLHETECNNALDYMNGDITMQPKSDFDIDKIVSSNYSNEHFFVFTYLSFLEILRDMLSCNLLKYQLEYSHCPFPSNEFHIVLKKSGKIQTDRELRHREIVRIQNIVNQVRGQREQFDWGGLTSFINKCDEVYFYGRASLADYIMRCVLDRVSTPVKGLVVSDGYDLPSWHMPVFHISDVPKEDKQAGFILCLLEKNSDIVAENLVRLRFGKIFNFFDC